jgi:hypothetical protein
MCRLSIRAVAYGTCSILLAWTARADVLITEVVPNVTTTATRGDIVELFNTGPGAVDLTGWILTDLDANPIAGVPQDATFAPGGLSVDPLEAGEFAVIDFVDASGTASWHATNYGLRIVAPLQVGSFLGSEVDELLLTDAANAPVDFVAWADANTVVSADSYDDLSAVTGAVFDYGLTPGDAAWAGAETIVSDADYYASAVDFTAFAAVSTWGGGAVRRRSVNGVFDVASPDGAAQWEAVPRHQASLGNASDDVPSGMGLRPIRVTDDLAEWLGQIETTTFPERRIARFADQNPADFVAALAQEMSDFEGLLALAMSGSWEDAFAAAVPLGYEIVEFLDTVSGETFHLLRERTVPGDVGFTGRGVFTFFSGGGVRDNLVIEIPHPVFDSETLEQGALALPDVRPRVLAIAGAHRNNHPDVSLCDDDGAMYRISDVAHHPDNFFHAAHVWLETNLADMRTVQFHGFCCPGVAPYGDLTDDGVMTNGFDAVPGVADFGRIWGDFIEAQNFLADGVDLTTVALFGEDTTHLGGTNNLQGRVTNGVPIGTECTTPALAASGRFHHLEQDPDVREEPQHILDALNEALDAESTSTCAALPAVGCRTAGKSQAQMRDKDGGAKDRFLWKWLKGEVTDLAAFSDALNGAASYRVCLYDASASPQPRLDVGASAGGLCGDAPCWRTTGTTGYRYKDKAGISAGLSVMKLKSGVEGKAKVIAKASGENLTLPELPLTIPVVVQLLVDDGLTSECWQSTFSDAPKKNEATKFKAKQ